MVWKNSKKDNKPSAYAINKEVIAKERLKINSWNTELLRKSGIIHGINTLTGKKVKDSFVDVQLKNFLKNQEPSNKPKKKTKYFLKTNKKINKIQNKWLPEITDGSKLRANSEDAGLFRSSSKLKNYNNGIFKINPLWPNWNPTLAGSLINNRQESYLKAKREVSLVAYYKLNRKELPTYNELVSGYKLAHVASNQNSEHYNSFIRSYIYKNLLFKSFWFNKFVSTLVRRGKKLKVWAYILRTFSFLKNEFGRNPVVLLFEILELYRMPVKGLSPTSSTRKSVVRTHLVPWWKQYTQILRWVRHALMGPVKNYTSWNTRIKIEMLNLLNDSNVSLVKKRIESNFQLIAFGKIALHFRWHRRYSKRAVKAIRVADRIIYEK